MPRIEKLAGQIWRDPEFRSKWLIGGLLGSIPLVNLLVAGYFLRYARQLRTSGDLSLPDWDDWGALFFDGLRMVVLKLVFVGVPLLAGWLVAALLSWLLFFPLLGATLVLWMAAVHRYLLTQDWGRVFDLPAVGRKAWRMAPAMVVPTLAFWGLMLLGWPLLGFTFFLGFAPYLAYGTAVYLDTKAASGA